MSFSTPFSAALLLLLASFSACKNERSNALELRTERFASGEVSAKYWTRGGQKDSLYFSFDRSGAKTGELLFRNGKQEGQTRIFYPSGKLREEQFYKNGLREGRQIGFYESGAKQMEGDYRADKLDGQYRKWAPDGRLLVDAIFERDTLKKPVFQAKK